MQITLNNRQEEITGKTELTVQELILFKNFTFHMLVTKVNDKLIKKEVRSEVIIKEGDNVVVMHLISGG
ncbi:MAG: sulfur carrier protein ThiS [Bacteroidota bacterium]